MLFYSKPRTVTVVAQPFYTTAMTYVEGDVGRLVRQFVRQFAKRFQQSGTENGTINANR